MNKYDRRRIKIAFKHKEYVCLDVKGKAYFGLNIENSDVLEVFNPNDFETVQEMINYLERKSKEYYEEIYMTFAI